MWALLFSIAYVDMLTLACQYAIIPRSLQQHIHRLDFVKIFCIPKRGLWSEIVLRCGLSFLPPCQYEIYTCVNMHGQLLLSTQ